MTNTAPTRLLLRLHTSMWWKPDGKKNGLQFHNFELRKFLLFSETT